MMTKTAHKRVDRQDQEANKKVLLEVRNTIRNQIQDDKKQLSKQWMAFKEHCKKEDFRHDQFYAAKTREFNRVLPLIILKFIGSIKRAVRQQMRTKGGTCYSIVRDLCLYWDADRSGKISVSELRGILRSLSLITTEEEEREIIRFYASEGDQIEMDYQDLLQDIQRGEPTVIEYVTQEDELKKAKNEFYFERVNRSFNECPKIVEQFVEVAQDYIATKMRNEGGTPHSIIRSLILQYDHDYSGGLNAIELQTACIKSMKLQMSREQAEEIVKFYDLRKTGQMQFDIFYPHVSSGTQPLLHYNVKTPRTLTKLRENLSKNPLITHEFNAKPNKILEKFKIDVKLFLETKVKACGNSAKYWIFEAFHYWDPKGVKTLSNIDDIIGAARRLGVEANDELGQILLNSYDRDNNGKMHYQILVDELTRDDAHFISDATTQIYMLEKHKSATARIPQSASRILIKFKTALEAYVRKSKGNLFSRDILHGTCLRFDTNHTGKLSLQQLKQVCSELKLLNHTNDNENDEDIIALISWFDTNGTKTLDYNALTNQLYGEDISTKTITLPKLTVNKPIDTFNSSSTRKSITDKYELTLQKNMEFIESDASKLARNNTNRRKILSERAKLERKLLSIEEQRKKTVEEYKLRQSAKKNENLEK